MIHIHGRSYDLPANLQQCRCCKTGHLIWDGKRAWRCSSRNGRCYAGLTLDAVFDYDDVDILFETRQVDLSSLPLSAAILSEITRGKVIFPHVSLGDAGERLARLGLRRPSEEEAEENDPWM